MNAPPSSGHDFCCGSEARIDLDLDPHELLGGGQVVNGFTQVTMHGSDVGGRKSEVGSRRSDVQTSDGVPFTSDSSRRPRECKETVERYNSRSGTATGQIT